ncbi:MAG: helix-turn-helix transcriptional regulator [Oscillospiraceae bacterium]|nr:helix-turn-helix transcriptional regulator [Oscillospiraceae bacterium]
MALFEERFSALREEKKATQKAVGDVLGISDRAIRFYEIGKRRPDFDGLLALADYFDVSIDYLVGRTDKREVNR